MIEYQVVISEDAKVMLAEHAAFIYSVDEASKTVKVYCILDSRQNGDI